MSQQNNRNVSSERKATYYIGLIMVIVGFLVFFSVFISAATSFGSPMMIHGQDNGMGDFAMRGVVGMGLMIGGSVLMNVGSRGLAGSGVMLDPQRAREDLEPWSRMAGGMAKDALEEADIDLSGKGDDLIFDEKLRRLEQLRKDGLLTDEEYKQKRGEILSQKW